jgi:hypothetical protein
MIPIKRFILACGLGAMAYNLAACNYFAPTEAQRNETALAEAKKDHDQDRSEALLDVENKIAIAKLNLSYIESLPTKVDPAKLKLFEILGGDLNYEDAASRSVSDEAHMIQDDATWQPSGSGDKEEVPACPTGYAAMPLGATTYTCVPGEGTAK